MENKNNFEIAEGSEVETTDENKVVADLEDRVRSALQINENKLEDKLDLPVDSVILATVKKQGEDRVSAIKKKFHQEFGRNLEKVDIFSGITTSMSKQLLNDLVGLSELELPDDFLLAKKVLKLVDDDQFVGRDWGNALSKPYDKVDQGTGRVVSDFIHKRFGNGEATQRDLTEAEFALSISGTQALYKLTTYKFDYQIKDLCTAFEDLTLEYPLFSLADSGLIDVIKMLEKIRAALEVDAESKPNYPYAKTFEYGVFRETLNKAFIRLYTVQAYNEEMQQAAEEGESGVSET